MILLHGSNRIFDQFKIGKEYSGKGYNTLMEGLGVYMTENINIASKYGKYLYRVFVNEEDIFDATKKKNIVALINALGMKVDIPLYDYIDIEGLALGIRDGQYSITDCGQEICNCLDSVEEFYQMYQDKITYEDDCLLERIKDEFKELLKPIIKYNDKSLGVVYIGIKKLNILKIINKGLLARC